MQKLENLDNCAAHEIRDDVSATAKRKIEWGHLLADLEMAPLKNGRDGKAKSMLHRHITTIRISNHYITFAILNWFIVECA